MATIFEAFGITEKDVIQYGASLLFEHNGAVLECPVNADGSRCYDADYWYEVDFDRIDESDAAAVRALFSK